MIVCIRPDKPGSFSNTIKTTWCPTISQKPLLLQTTYQNIQTAHQQDVDLL